MSFMPEPTKHSYENPPTGTHIAIAYRVLDLGTQPPTEWQPKQVHKVFIDFELPECKRADGKPMTTGKYYTYSSHEKATLRLHLESWRGKRFTDEEIRKFDLFSVIKKPCLLNIVEKENGGTKIASIGSLPKSMKAIDVSIENPTVALWLTKELFKTDEFMKLSDSMKKIVSQSPEYKALFEEGSQVANAAQDLPDEIPF